jgi:hypothetical protein
MCNDKLIIIIFDILIAVACVVCSLGMWSEQRKKKNEIPN